MSKQPWPYQDFNEYLEALMYAARIADRAELSRLSDVDQTQLSNWRRGKTRPSRESLLKIARVLSVQPVNLYVMAGLDSPEDLGLDGAPDLTVLPPELRDLIELYQDPAITEDIRQTVRTLAAALVSGLRHNIELAKAAEAATPPKRRQRRSPAA